MMSSNYTSLAKAALKWAVAYAALVTALFTLVPSHIHRHEFDQAFMAWYKNRTPQTEAALRIQEHKTEIIRLEDSAIAALVLLGAFAAVRFALRSVRRARSSNVQML